MNEAVYISRCLSQSSGSHSSILTPVVYNFSVMMCSSTSEMGKHTYITIYQHFFYGGGICFVLFSCLSLILIQVAKNHLVLISALSDKIMQHLGKPSIKMNTSKPTQINPACHYAHTNTPNLGVWFFV